MQGCSLAFASQHRLVLEAEFVEDGYHGEPTVVALWKEAGDLLHSWRLQVQPIGKGMSSSAALCLSIVLCVHGASIDKQAACEEAQRLEHVVLGTPCGLLDQMTMMHSLEGNVSSSIFQRRRQQQRQYPLTGTSNWLIREFIEP